MNETVKILNDIRGQALKDAYASAYNAGRALGACAVEGMQFTDHCDGQALERHIRDIGEAMRNGYAKFRANLITIENGVIVEADNG